MVATIRNKTKINMEFKADNKTGCVLPHEMLEQQ
jgi:hypothetical protein